MDEERRDDVYFGIDLSAEDTIVSFYQLNMEEPETISTVVGSEAYRIPTFLAKRKGIGQWFFGAEAKRQVSRGAAVGISNFFETAVDGGKIFVETEEYSARDLLTIFLRMLLALPGRRYAGARLARLCICVERLNMQVVETMTVAAGRLGIEPGRLLVLDRRESFYYYALSQEPSLFFHDVLLFDCRGNSLSHCILSRDESTRPQTIQLLQETDEDLVEDRDMQFHVICQRILSERTISSVYLIGDGFDGDWMKLSLAGLLKGRRVFQGKNLYSKGACYAGAIRDGKKDWPFVYIGNNELKVNVSLKVLRRSQMQFITLLTAGESWYEQRGECEVILDGSPEIECWLQRPESRKAEIRVLSLHDFPDRENRTTRLRIEAAPISDRSVRMTIRDLGFGEMVPSTGRIWEHTVSIDG